MALDAGLLARERIPIAPAAPRLSLGPYVVPGSRGTDVGFGAVGTF
jgi:hypothetical protein